MMKCFYICKDKVKSKAGTAGSIPDLSNEAEQNLRVFSLVELGEATSNFNSMLKIGEGCFWSVYRGSITPANEDGDFTIVAIKKLNTQRLQGHMQWVAEVQYLGVLSHPNLAKLLGYCFVDGERGVHRLLVYEYMPNKSLEDHLFDSAMPTIPWITRLNIMLGAAQGLAYLHEGLEVQVIYRDFKSTNVLLDKEFNAKLSDFGLFREETHASAGVCCPEYAETGHFTIKSDIWSFGVVLYEILTGRRTLERDHPAPEQNLLDWMKQFPSNTRRFSMIIDPRLQNQYYLDAAKKIARLADSCLNQNPEDRPAMSEVVEKLKQAIEDSKVTSSDTRSSPLRNYHSASDTPFGAMEMKDATRQIVNIA